MSHASAAFSQQHIDVPRLPVYSHWAEINSPRSRDNAPQRARQSRHYTNTAKNSPADLYHFSCKAFLFHTHTLGCIKFSSLSVVQQTRVSMYGFLAPWLAVLQIAAPWLAGSVPIHCTLSPEHSYSGKFPFKVSPWKRQWSAKLQLPKRFQLFSCPEIALNSTLTLD